ncbi:MAG TPA: hypothetical protein VMS17_01140 [Gemmataceae bacterium]|nr:hypothetical protein [Gemmataceae bacterium]
MELLGKILVIATLGLSLLMAAIGGAVYFYRVDWTDTKATADQPAGELVARQEKVKQAAALLAPADKAWSEARAALPPAEERRKQDVGWYAQQLQNLETGKSVLALDYQNAATVPDKNNNGLPAMVPVQDRYGNPLMSATDYATAIAGKNTEILNTFEKLLATAQEDVKLTLRLIGPSGVADVTAKVDDEIKALAPKADDDEDTKTYKNKLIDMLTKHRGDLEALKGATAFARGLDQRIRDEKAKLEGVIGVGGEMASAQENGKTVWKVKVGDDGKRVMTNDGEMALVQMAKGLVQVDYELLQSRKLQLEARKKQLEKPAVTATTP